MRHAKLEQQIMAAECMLDYHSSELNPADIPTIQHDLEMMHSLAARIRNMPDRGPQYDVLSGQANELANRAASRMAKAKQF